MFLGTNLISGFIQITKGQKEAYFLKKCHSLSKLSFFNKLFSFLQFVY